MDSSDDETRDVAAPTGETTPAFRVSAAVLVGSDEARYDKGVEIARGGLGRISTAIDRKLDRRVAIKELHERTDAGAARFAREALITAKLQHPAIVPVLDSGRWANGDPYLVMKLLEGKTLADELELRRTTDARLALVPNLLAIADALGYAHERGVVHRDVKPANIMIGTHGETVLLDWGVAYDGGEFGGEVAGTARYMSPEQARGDRPTPAFDVFGLGATLATVLAGAHGRPVPPEIPADLAAIVTKATAADGRYPDGSALADDLRKFIAGQLVGARVYSRRQLIARWMRRNRVLLAVAGVAAAAIAVTATIAVRSVIDERDQAIARRAEADARAEELVLLQARVNLAIDPTATIAWLKQYPSSAPHQDEVLALVDEATGRGVARHVWRTPTTPEDVRWTPDGRAIVSVHDDGEIWRADVATGKHEKLATLDRPLDDLVARDDALFALDRDGGIWRWRAGAIAKYATVPLPSRATGIYPAGGELKVTYVDDQAMYFGAEVPGEPHPLSARPVPFDFAFFDDENSATALYGVSSLGEVARIDHGEPRILHVFRPRTWVRSSEDGKRYAAIVPGDPFDVYVGNETTAPVQIGTTRRCAGGEDQEEESDVANSGRYIALRRCGELGVYDARQPKRTLVIDQPDRVNAFELADDDDWLAIGRATGLEVIDLANRRSRLFAGSAVTFAKYAPGYGQIVSVGPEQGERVWSLAHDPAIELDTVVAPARLAIPTGAGRIEIVRHLACFTKGISDRRVDTDVAIQQSQVRMPDDEALLWPWDTSVDGTVCVFAATSGGAILALPGTTRTLASPGDGLLQCVLVGDDAVCRTEKNALVTYAIATGAPGASRRIEGTVRALVRFRGEAIAVVERAGGCALETAAGKPIGTLPAGCRTAQAGDAGQLGDETAIIVRRTTAVDVWTPAAGATTISLDQGLVDVGHTGGLAAVARQRTIELWDLATHARRAGIEPSEQPRAITALAWSSAGVLASSDAETVRLWDAHSGRTRVVFAEHVVAIVWAKDGKTLFTTDGREIRAWPVDLERGASPREVRARMEQLTTARIVDGRAETR